MVEAGERRYDRIRGPQGPLVYPAGFVWLYGGLRRLTDGVVSAAQPWFAAMYVADVAAAAAIYSKAFGDDDDGDRRFPPIALCLLAASRRAHSVFALRLFNDAPCALFMRLAVLLLISDWTKAACVLFSAAVSVKMSALLYAPAWYVALASRGGHRGAARGIALCAAVQAALAAPFLAADPRAYVVTAFDFGRGFKHKWSVNFKWVPCRRHDVIETDLADCEGPFASTWFKALTLGAHLVALLVAAERRWCRPHGGLWNFFFKNPRTRLTPLALAAMLFECNFIGMTFARSLHFQFVVWYHNSLPFLAACTDLPRLAQLLLLLAIEAAWNPWGSSDTSSLLSSLLLTLAHFFLLLALLSARPLVILKKKDP
ncbi:hypothetical protein CTAYLR_005523 [Chrysophaeum taylorii]|uniref:dolichyl-P-Man:Man5GlcNAc2-PP-dolichol alpha-1,3-mannosyltransferase n=1 Tax=Chrysophaeum taylorii TaxID=2483200 RepID=A0AAD7XGA9_9STRA|nr:hypothetical protein CTAYLR_005523 [Chrysophaeum taylorii]